MAFNSLNFQAYHKLINGMHVFFKETNKGPAKRKEVSEVAVITPSEKVCSSGESDST